MDKAFEPYDDFFVRPDLEALTALTEALLDLKCRTKPEGRLVSGGQLENPARAQLTPA